MTQTLKKDRRCYYCRRKATRMLGGHPSCDQSHVQPMVQPTVRVGRLREGRGKFLEMLRARIKNVPLQYPNGDAKLGLNVLADVLTIVDAAVERYKGE